MVLRSLCTIFNWKKWRFAPVEQEINRKISTETEEQIDLEVVDQEMDEMNMEIDLEEVDEMMNKMMIEAEDLVQMMNQNLLEDFVIDLEEDKQ